MSPSRAGARAVARESPKPAPGLASGPPLAQVLALDPDPGQGPGARALWHRLATRPERPDLDPPPGGRPLPEGVRGRLERGFGRPLDGIRVHDDARAQDYVARRGAQAVALGNRIYLSAAHRDPERGGGFRVLAHEVAHTLQQGAAGPGSGDVDPRRQRHLEIEADTAALRVAAGERVEVRPAGIPSAPQHLDAGAPDQDPGTVPPDADQAADLRADLGAQGERLLARLRGMGASTLSLTPETVERIDANYARLVAQVGIPGLMPDTPLRGAPGSHFVPAAAPVAAGATTAIPIGLVIAAVAALLLVLAVLAFALYWLIQRIFDDLEQSLDTAPLPVVPQTEPAPGPGGTPEEGRPTAPLAEVDQGQTPETRQDEDQDEQARPCCCEVVAPLQPRLMGRISGGNLMGHWLTVGITVANRRARAGEVPGECRYLWSEGLAGMKMDTHDGDQRPDMEAWRTRTRAADDPTCSWRGTIEDQDMPAINLSDTDKDLFRALRFDVTATSGCNGTSQRLTGIQVLNTLTDPGNPTGPKTPLWIGDRDGVQRSWLDFGGARLDPEPYRGPVYGDQVIIERIPGLGPARQ